MNLINLFKKKEQTEMITEETLPDVQQIKVPDLKQLVENSIEEAIKIMEHWIEYEKNNKEKINRADELNLLNGYKEIREVKNQNEQLQLKLEEESKYKLLYDGALVTLEEFKKREDENKKQINNLQTKLNEKQEELSKLYDLVNTYKIKQLEVDKQSKNMDKVIKDNIDSSIIDFKEKIIEAIKNTKGNVSKDKVCNLIQRMGVDKNE